MSQTPSLRSIFTDAMEPVRRLGSSPSPMNTAHLPIVIAALETVVAGVIDVLMEYEQRFEALEAAGDPQSFSGLTSRLDADEARQSAFDTRLGGDENKLAADDTRFGTDEDQLAADKVLIHSGDAIPGADTALGDAFTRLPPDGSPATGSTTTPTTPVIGVGDVPVPQDSNPPQGEAVVEAPVGSVPGLTPQTPVQEVTVITGGGGATPQVIRDQAPSGEVGASSVEGSQETPDPASAASTGDVPSAPIPDPSSPAGEMAPPAGASAAGVASVEDVPPAVAPYVDGAIKPPSQV